MRDGAAEPELYGAGAVPLALGYGATLTEVVRDSVTGETGLDAGLVYGVGVITLVSALEEYSVADASTLVDTGDTGEETGEE